MESLQIKKLYLNGANFNIDATIAKINSHDNAHSNALYIDNMNPAIFYLLSNLSEHEHEHEHNDGDPDSAFTKYNLEILTLAQDFLSLGAAHAVANFIADVPLLKLELLGCNRNFGAPITIIIGSIDKSLLQTLNLSDAYIKEKDAKAIVNLMVSPHLTKLSFIRCKFECNAQVAIFSAIKRSSIKTLILDWATFDDEGTIIIADCIAHSKLTKLSLFAVSFAFSKQHMVLEAIKQSSIKTLDVRGHIGKSIFSNFDTINDLILHKCEPITKFKFSQHTFNTQKRIAIIDSIQGNCSSEHIHFDDKNLSAELLTKICEALEDKRRHLKSFDLYCALLSSASLIKIFDSIKRSSITFLDIVDFAANPACISHIYDLLENYNLEKLGITVINVNQTMKQILPAMQKSSLIKFSAHNFVDMSEQMRDTVEQILQVNRRNLYARNIKSTRSQKVNI